ncbi:hypothetical protein HMPREF9997_01228 [Corynebacterium durum F0235]|uniref:Uncharacterized protein n=1 Tax=Corynebacterium durum F0235 TaxID=1035195 RepID=L1MHL4_9CORY|nr:hypothetical protein HMPREF9997_01228 [Corynebacterium durum F0235]
MKTRADALRTDSLNTALNLNRGGGSMKRQLLHQGGCTWF